MHVQIFVCLVLGAVLHAEGANFFQRRHHHPGADVREEVQARDDLSEEERGYGKRHGSEEDLAAALTELLKRHHEDVAERELLSAAAAVPEDDRVGLVLRRLVRASEDANMAKRFEGHCEVTSGCGDAKCFGTCPKGTANCVTNSNAPSGRFCYDASYNVIDQRDGDLARTMANLAKRFASLM